MKRKVIGIPGYSGKDSNNFGVGNNHLNFLHTFGNVRIIMPWEEKVDIDLLYLPGGLDTSPMNYGEIPGYSTSAQDVFKEFFFKEKLHHYVDNTPIVGVCLGMQMLAVHFGCKLTQNLLFHPQSGRWDTAHRVYSQLSDKGVIVKKSENFEVNSHHHQAVTLRGASKEIVPLLYAENEDNYITGDGAIIEAFSHNTLPIYGLQWHPEELYDPYTLSIFKYLLDDRK